MDKIARRLLLALAFSLASIVPASAGIADSPLPVLSVGVDTLHLYSVPGAIASGSLGTFFSCTSTDTATMQVGVELFGPRAARHSTMPWRPRSASPPVRP